MHVEFNHTYHHTKFQRNQFIVSKRKPVLNIFFSESLELSSEIEYQPCEKVAWADQQAKAAYQIWSKSINKCVRK